MPILFTHNYNIIQEKEEEYRDFISETYIPATASLGLTTVGAYYVEIGSGPRIIGVMSVGSFDELSRIIITKEFKDLTLGLKSFVYDYGNAVLEPTGRVKQGEYKIQKNVWKLNQYFDLRPGTKKDGYKDFIINEHLPTLEKIDYVEVTGGWNRILGGISEIIAEFTFKDPVDIGRLMNNEDFRRITLKLRNQYVRNYSSRVLRCTERFDEPKWFSL